MGLHEIGFVAIVLAVGSAVFAVLSSLGWPGTAHECLALADCYCEVPRPGWVRQPANTLSCVSGVIVGFAIAIHSRSRRRVAGSGPLNRMMAGPFYPSVYASIVTYSGFGAAFFHGSLTEWGGKLDMVSMHLSFGFWLVYNLTRRFDRSKAWFSLVFSVLTATLLIPRVVFGLLGFQVFAGLVSGVILSEILVATGPSRGKWNVSLNRSWLWVSLGLYVPALAVWRFSLSGQPLCCPDSLLQGHALWHVMTALSPGALYLYVRNGERGGPAA